MKRLIQLIIISFFAVACSAEKQVADGTISVDVEAAKGIDVRGGELAVLTLSSDYDSGLLGLIMAVSFSGDDIIVEALNGLYKYDGRNGKRLTTFAGKGRARSEYTSIWSHWVDSNMVYIYDLNSKKVLCYDVSGESVSSLQVSMDAASSPFQMVVPYADGYIGKRMYDGLGQAEELAIYDAEFCFVKYIPSFKIRSGIKFHDPFARFGDIVLYNRYFDNIIYEVSEDGVSPRYTVDFQEYALNTQAMGDEYDITDYMRKHTDGAYASLISNIYESKAYLAFSYLFDGAKYVAIYNKAKGGAQSFYFEGDDIDVAKISCNNDKIYILFSDSDNDYIGVAPISGLER